MTFADARVSDQQVDLARFGDQPVGRAAIRDVDLHPLAVRAATAQNRKAHRGSNPKRPFAPQPARRAAADGLQRGPCSEGPGHAQIDVTMNVYTEVSDAMDRIFPAADSQA